MSSKREEERNEKIIRGLMKLPPNRRCINCNILGPQYVCTNFWTFVCMTCSGIHREFTHRVKSVSMAKFTSQEVDALQKGGNQRARELFMKSWDPQRQRLPDNSNIDKLREFIKNIYVDRKYVTDKSSDKPPNDPQSLRRCEDETRRASSYHSYSQSPPYDFQYEERRYGKHAPVLSRKPGSDRGIYNGKLASFLSPSRFSDHVTDDRFANEGSCPRFSDYSVSAGSDPFRTGIHSPSSQREVGSPSSDTSRDFYAETPRDSAVSHNLDGDRKGGGARVLQPQRTASSGSFGSYNSNSFKSVNSLGMAEGGSGPEKPTMISLEKSYCLPPLPQSSASGTFGGLDLFEVPSAPQAFASTAPIGTNSRLPETAVAQSSGSFQQTTIAPVSMFPELKHSQIPQSSPLELNTMEPKQQLVSSSAEKTSDVVTPINGGWATFDTPQNLGTENFAPVAMNVGGNVAETFNPFSLDQKSSYQEFADHCSLTSDHTLWHESIHNVEPSINNNQVWNAFEDSNPQTVQTVLQNNEKPVPNIFSDGFDVPALAGTHANSHKSINPFDLPDDATSIEPGNMFWEMGSLQAALPNTQDSTSYDSGLNQSWFTPNPNLPFVSNGLSFESPNGSLEFIAGQTPAPQVQNIHAQGHAAASVGGNPFA